MRELTEMRKLDLCKRSATNSRLALAMVLLVFVGFTGMRAMNASAQPAKAAGDASAQDLLLFPKDQYTVETKTVKTTNGEKKVVYQLYAHLLYVTKPVDKDYESLDVKVPVTVDGVAVDATKAPIFFSIGVGGYMSVNNAKGAGGPGGGPAGGPGGVGGPARGPVGPGGPGGARGPTGPNKADLALAAGYVVVEPGCRGRDNKATDGTYYGKAPAVIVDLKAAVRYIRHNEGVMPGNVKWIVSSGCSAGGAASALLGASGNSHLYDAYLKEIGAADADDSIFAAGCGSPITDLDHSDMAMEWRYGSAPLRTGGLVDQALSKQLQASFAEYQASLKLRGKNGFGTLTAGNYAQYLMKEYLVPSANQYFIGLAEDKRREYLEKNTWLTWDGKSVKFDYAEYVTHMGRGKGLPAYDDFDLKSPETALFGSKTSNARHFTNFSLQHATGNPNAKIDAEMQTLVNLMNPMYFIGQRNNGAASHWWIRYGTAENGGSQTVAINLAAGLENMGRDANAWLYWDAGHCQDLDPEGFIAWIGKITGFKNHN